MNSFIIKAFEHLDLFISSLSIFYHAFHQFIFYHFVTLDLGHLAYDHLAFFQSTRFLHWVFSLPKQADMSEGMNMAFYNLG
jgi:hypothetical protein